MSKNIDDINRKILADNERARSMDQLCEEGTFSGPFRKKPTLTDSEVKKMVGNYEVDDFAAGFAAGFRHAGGEIIPDPEPMNAEHDRAWWIENANVNDAEDCEACVDDLCPVHHGIALGIEFVTKKIAALGDDPELFNSIPNPPKAPGGDDE